MIIAISEYINDMSLGYYSDLNFIIWESVDISFVSVISNFYYNYVILRIRLSSLLNEWICLEECSIWDGR